jgi:hypothetical protein
MIEVGRTQYKSSLDAADLWKLVVQEEPIRGMPAAEQANAQGRLTKWVTESTQGSMVFGTKGRFYRHNTPADVARMLHGRINEGAAKHTEAELAQKIHDNATIRDGMHLIHRMLRERVNGFSAEDQETWKKQLEKTGRYGFFWGTSSFSPRGNRTVWEGLQGLTGKWGGTASCTIIAAWLCDFALAARKLPGGPSGALPFMEGHGIKDASRIPDGIAGGKDGTTRFNANESSDWVQRARAAQVRIGAGPSNTTGQVLSAVDTLLDGQPGYEKATHGWYTGLSLFAFWTRHRAKLQTSSEIHTYHEVMCVVRAFGIDGPRAAFQVGVDASTHPVIGQGAAEFEYLSPAELP